MRLDQLSVTRVLLICVIYNLFLLLKVGAVQAHDIEADIARVFLLVEVLVLSGMLRV